MSVYGVSPEPLPILQMCSGGGGVGGLQGWRWALHPPPSILLPGYLQPSPRKGSAAADPSARRPTGSDPPCPRGFPALGRAVGRSRPSLPGHSLNPDPPPPRPSAGDPGAGFVPRILHPPGCPGAAHTPGKNSLDGRGGPHLHTHPPPPTPPGCTGPGGGWYRREGGRAGKRCCPPPDWAEMTSSPGCEPMGEPPASPKYRPSPLRWGGGAVGKNAAGGVGVGTA